MNLEPLYEEAIQFNNFNGTVLAAGKVEVWYLGRTRKADIYADVAGETPLPNPFDLNNLGMQQVYVNPAFNYTLVVYDPYGSELFSIDKYLQSAGVHTTSNVVVQPSENIGVSAWTVGEVQIYQPYLIGEVGKTYEGILPIVVNNSEDKISANHVALGLQEPLFFVQDDENACIIGCSAQTEIPSSVSSKWEDASDTVSNNSAQWGAGTVYTPGNYIDIQDDVISVTGLQPAGDYAYNSAVSSKLDTTAFSTVSGNFLTAVDLTPYQEKTAMTGYLTTGDSAQFYTNDNPSGFITGVDLSDYATTGDLVNKLDTTAFSNVSGDFITALPADLVYTGDLTSYAQKDFVLSAIDSSTSGLLPTSSFSSVSGSFITALPSDLVYTADITGKLDTSVYSAESAMLSGAIDYVSANIVDPVSSPLGTILVNGSEIEGTNSAINLTGVKTPYTSATSVNVSQFYEFYPLNFGTISTGSILNISGFDGHTGTFVIIGKDSANNQITLEFNNQSGSLGNIVSDISASMFDGLWTGNYNFELSSYTLGSGVDELAWKTDLNDLPSYDYLRANYQPQSAMTDYLTQVGAIQNFQLKQNMTAYQPVSGMTAYQEAGEYYSASNPSGFITGVDLTPYQTTADMVNYQTTAGMTGYLTTADSANFYTTANESGYLTEVPDTYLQNIDLSTTEGKVTAISGIPLAAGGASYTSPSGSIWISADNIESTDSAYIPSHQEDVLLTATTSWSSMNGYATLANTNKVYFITEGRGSAFDNEGTFLNSSYNSTVSAETEYPPIKLFTNQWVSIRYSAYSAGIMDAYVVELARKNEVNSALNTKLDSSAFTGYYPSNNPSGFAKISDVVLPSSFNLFEGKVVGVNNQYLMGCDSAYNHNLVGTSAATGSLTASAYVGTGHQGVTIEVSGRQNGTYYINWTAFSENGSNLSAGQMAFQSNTAHKVSAFEFNSPLAENISGVKIYGNNHYFTAYSAYTTDVKPLVSQDNLTFLSGAIDHVTANSAAWNETTVTVNSNSGAWGGSALPISAGAGISLSMVDGILVISTAGV